MNIEVRAAPEGLRSEAALAARTDSELTPLVMAEQIRLVYVKGFLPYVAALINATLYMTYMWRQSPHGRVLGWLGAVAIINGMRIWLCRVFVRNYRGPADAPRWGRVATVASAIHGVVWGSTALFFYTPGSLIGQMLLAVVACGMIAGSSTLTNSYLPSYAAFALPAMAPPVIRLLIGPTSLGRLLGVLLLVFAIAMVAVAVAGSRSSREAAQLRFRLLFASNRLAELNDTLESRVAERTEALQSALAVRDEFLAVASHELKTPLTSLRMQLQIFERELRRTGLRTRARLTARLGILARQGSRLSLLVNTLLDVSSMAESKLKLEASEIDLAQIVRRVATEMTDDLRLHGSTLSVQADGPLVGAWDPIRLEQIIVNLLSNAAKYGAGNPIEVMVGQDGASARITVVDHGIGIAPRDLARIFGKYERASPARSYGGLGLGLFVVQQLVSAMGGTIEVDSTPGASTRFTVRLPSASGWVTSSPSHGHASHV